LDITQEQFDSLLDWLDHDRDTAGRKYETIREGLLRIFAAKGFSDAEDLVDETINRVIIRLPDIKDTYEGDPARFFHGVARNIIRERLRRKLVPLDDESVLPDPPSEKQEDDRHECLDLCLDVLQAQKRDLLLTYLEHEGREKIEHHKQMARELGITEGALRGRVHQIRSGVEQCVKQCVRRRENENARNIIVSDLATGGGNSSFKKEIIS
jgi:RNA polymerase sigma factor (sigma-70 family)